jgi:hypothetical protein
MGAQVFLRELGNGEGGSGIPKCGMIWSLEWGEDNSKFFLLCKMPENLPVVLCNFHKNKKLVKKLLIFRLTSFIIILVKILDTKNFIKKR